MTYDFTDLVLPQHIYTCAYYVSCICTVSSDQSIFSSCFRKNYMGCNILFFFQWLYTYMYTSQRTVKIYMHSYLQMSVCVFAEIANEALLHSSMHFPKMKNFVKDRLVIMTSPGVQTQDNWTYRRFRSNWQTGRNNFVIFKTKQNNNKHTTIQVTELRWDEQCRY